jgi:hypothetical protein
LAHSLLLISRTSKPSATRRSRVRGNPAGISTRWLKRIELAAASSPSLV